MAWASLLHKCCSRQLPFFDGDPLSQRWSIGYYSPNTAALGPLQGLFGQETGICDYGHLKSEGDASIIRGDFLAPTMNSNCP